MQSAVKKPEMNEKDIFTTVLKHCLAIILAPITSFFIAKLYVFDALLQLESVPSNLYSAFVAVIVLHLALGNFIYRAYFDTDTVQGFDKKED